MNSMLIDFLKKNGETRSVRELRDELRAIDMDFNKRMAVVEFLLFKFSKTVQDFVRKPQGGNAEGLEEAQRQLEHAQASLSIAVASYEKASEEARLAAEAEAQLKAALDDLAQQENAFHQLKADLTARSEEGGIVSRNKAKAELAQLEATDPLPLRQAKLNTEAANRKAEKARAAADEAAQLASNDLAAAEAAFQEAEDYMNDLKANSGSGGQGSLWWIDRELQEAKRFMPRGGMRHNF